MKIHLMSDLHLEFAPIELCGGDVLLLAGDICVANDINGSHASEIISFFKEATKLYSKVYYIAGNHEHYYSEFTKTHILLQNMFIENHLNVTFLDNEVVQLNDEYMLYGATFWTDFNNFDILADLTAGKSMNDFRVIRDCGYPLRPGATSLLNSHHRVTLKDAVEKHKDKKFIVMTHHTPSMKSCHPRYGTNLINYAYSNTRLEDFILDNPNIKYWVHGHTHDSFDYKIGECRVLCNPRGYARFSEPSICENEMFDLNLTLEI